MRTNGHDGGERFTARLNTEEPMTGDKRDDDEDELLAGEVPAAPGSKAAKPRASAKRNTKPPVSRRSGPPSRVSKTPPPPVSAPVIAVKPEPPSSPSSKAKKNAAKGGGGPKSRRSVPPAEVMTPPPPSVDPKRTLLDPPAVASKRASRAPKQPKPVAHAKPSVHLDEHDEKFFAEGEAASQHGEPLQETLRVLGGHPSSETDPRMHAPAVSPERRAKLAKYVKWAVAAAGLLCLAALVAAVGRSAHPVQEASASAAPAVTQAAAAPTPPLPTVAAAAPAAPTAAAPAPAVAAPASAAPAAPVATQAPAAVVADAPAAAAPASAAPVAAVDPSVPAKSAKEEREAARKALESGKLKDAIEAASRAVAVDPTDGEAWLLLGAAHQESGHGKSAREAYTACVKQGKSGPISECRAMLR